MSDIVTIRGFAATRPELRALPSGVPVASFRVASTPRWFDAASGTWQQGRTNWYTVTAFRRLAKNIAASIDKGHPVLLTGRLQIKQFTHKDGSSGSSAEIDAQSIGVDLGYGTCIFERGVERRDLAPQNQNEQHPEHAEPITRNSIVRMHPETAPETEGDGPVRNNAAYDNNGVHCDNDRTFEHADTRTRPAAAGTDSKVQAAA